LSSGWGGRTAVTHFRGFDWKKFWKISKMGLIDTTRPGKAC